MIIVTSMTGRTRLEAVATSLRAGAPGVTAPSVGAVARETVITRGGSSGSLLLLPSGAVAMDVGTANAPMSDSQLRSSVPQRLDL